MKGENFHSELRVINDEDNMMADGFTTAAAVPNHDASLAQHMRRVTHPRSRARCPMLWMPALRLWRTSRFAHSR